MQHVEKALDISFLAIINEACSSEEAQAAGWRIKVNSVNSKDWIYVHNTSAVTPQQGWKLHISATVWSAEEILHRVLPILLTEDASFKVARSTYALDELNSGRAGLSQIGKFITIYPNSDTQAVHLAVSLHTATRGCVGPSILSDRPLIADSLVHYRYGGFGGRYVQTPLGPILPALVTPNGDLTPDQRPTYYDPPKWAVDPFHAAGVASDIPSSVINVGKQYLAITKLHQSSLNAVYLGIDIENTRSCVFKRARRGTAAGPHGQDARDHLRHECEVLRRLAPDSRFPMVFDLIERDSDLFLIMEEIKGETLESYMERLLVRSRLPQRKQVIAWGRELCSMLEKIHASGLVYDDLKPTNVMVASDGRLCLIDFGTAHEGGSCVGQQRFGTHGYMSPQQASGMPSAITDDVYSLGIMLYYMATKADPSFAPDPFALLDRPPDVLNPAIGPALTQVIAGCLELDPRKRFASSAAVDAALAYIAEKGEVARPLFRSESAVESEETVRRHYRKLAQRLSTTLSMTAQRGSNGSGLVWRSSHPITNGTLPRDINAGSAGAVLALAELVAELGYPQQRAVLADGARWLIAAPPSEGQPLPGLYVGESGIGAALLRAGQVLKDEVFIRKAAERSRKIAMLPHTSPDLFHGTAGRLRFHLLLWDETHDTEHLRAALEAGKTLLATAEDTGDGGIQWTIPPGYENLSGRAYVGYAHGAAGIADALLDLFEASGEERFLETARRTGGKLGQLALLVLDDQSGRDWPSTQGEDASGGSWCHGAAGVGRFFLHAAQLGIIEEAADMAAGAARTVAQGSRWANPVQCHGLAGSIEFLLDMYQATSDQAYLSEARTLGRLLETFGKEQEGLLMWSSESPRVFSPDYMIGYAGVAVCLLRLSDPERLPHQLSRRGFRHSSQQAGKGILSDSVV